MIRSFQSDDAPHVVRLHRRALEGTGADAGVGPWDDDLCRIEEVYLHSGGAFYVGVVAGEIVAMGALKRTGLHSAEIKRMRVDPTYQRRGFGQAILHTLETRAEELGVHRLHLDTGQVQHAAQRLYEKNGYRRVAEGEVHDIRSFYYEKYLLLRGK